MRSGTAGTKTSASKAAALPCVPTLALVFFLNSRGTHTHVPLLGHFSKPGYTRLELGSRTFTGASHVGRNPITSATPAAATQACMCRKLEPGAEPRPEPRHETWDTGVPSSHLIAQPMTHPLLSFSKVKMSMPILQAVHPNPG